MLSRCCPSHPFAYTPSQPSCRQRARSVPSRLSCHRGNIQAYNPRAEPLPGSLLFRFDVPLPGPWQRHPQSGSTPQVVNDRLHLHRTIHQVLGGVRLVHVPTLEASRPDRELELHECRADLDPDRLDPDVPHPAARGAPLHHAPPTARRATPPTHHPLAHVHPGGRTPNGRRTALGAPYSHPSATRSGRPPPRERRCADGNAPNVTGRL
jgi:hypothetical protein